MNENKKIIIPILIVVFIIMVGVVVTYKVIENRAKNRENLKCKVENVSSTPIETLDYEQSKKSFFGKVIEVNASYIIVEPNEDEVEKNQQIRFLLV